MHRDAKAHPRRVLQSHVETRPQHPLVNGPERESVPEECLLLRWHTTEVNNEYTFQSHADKRPGNNSQTAQKVGGNGSFTVLVLSSSSLSCSRRAYITDKDIVLTLFPYVCVCVGQCACVASSQLGFVLLDKHTYRKKTKKQFEYLEWGTEQHPHNHLNQSIIACI